MTTYIFDIARGSLNDGPGIRTTVFLKGCPLRCLWCHNPASQCFDPQLSYNASLCISCGNCAAVCPAGAHKFSEGIHSLDLSLCKSHGRCETVCPSSAVKLFGYPMTARETFEKVKSDKAFFDASGGGITVSGGEPLSHADFCTELFSLCKSASIHTCVETSGMGSTPSLLKLASLTDLFLYDWKLSNNADAEKYTGADITVIEHNLDALINFGAKILLRCPIIPDVNDNDGHFGAICGLLKKYPTLHAEFLPYHSFGVGKSEKIGSVQQKFRTPSEEEKQNWLRYFSSRGFSQVCI